MYIDILDLLMFGIKYPGQQSYLPMSDAVPLHGLDRHWWFSKTSLYTGYFFNINIVLYLCAMSTASIFFLKQLCVLTMDVPLHIFSENIWTKLQPTCL